MWCEDVSSRNGGNGGMMQSKDNEGRRRGSEETKQSIKVQKRDVE